MRGVRIGVGLASLALLPVFAGCSSDPKPVYQDEAPTTQTVAEYDATLEPSAAVLSLVPAEAGTVMVTDFDQLRLVLGFGSLTGASPPAEQAKFWRRVPRTSALSAGLLRPFDAQLREEFSISQDDVAWEASYSGDVQGWVLAFHPKTSVAAIARAIRAGVGPLKGAILDADRHLVTSAPTPEPDAAWGADPALVRLGGREAVGTYLTRSCLPFDTVFGEGMQAQLATAPAAALGALHELDAFAVVLGSELATVLLGDERSDAFDRARLAEIMPPTQPEFPLALSRPVADPAGGRLGYTLSDPAAAAELTRTQHLPFAVCAS